MEDDAPNMEWRTIHQKTTKKIDVKKGKVDHDENKVVEAQGMETESENDSKAGEEVMTRERKRKKFSEMGKKTKKTDSEDEI